MKKLFQKHPGCFQGVFCSHTPSLDCKLRVLRSQVTAHVRARQDLEREKGGFQNQLNVPLCTVEPGTTHSVPFHVLKPAVLDG